MKALAGATSLRASTSNIEGAGGFDRPGGYMDLPERAGENSEEQLEEARKIRRLQMLISMVMSVISQDPNLTLEEAATICANTKRAALAMFPDKEFAYDILYKPRLQRIMNERFRIK